MYGMDYSRPGSSKLLLIFAGLHDLQASSLWPIVPSGFFKEQYSDPELSFRSLK